jgi:hypothetical protein
MTHFPPIFLIFFPVKRLRINAAASHIIPDCHAAALAAFRCAPGALPDAVPGSLADSEGLNTAESCVEIPSFSRHFQPFSAIFSHFSHFFLHFFSHFSHFFFVDFVIFLLFFFRRFLLVFFCCWGLG